MKVLLVIDGLGTGGSERSVAELQRALCALGVEAIATPLLRRGIGVETELVARGYDVRFLDARSLATATRSLRRIVRSERPDIVHTTLFRADVAGRLAAAGRPSAVVTSIVTTGSSPATDDDARPSAAVRWKARAATSIDGLTARHLANGFHAVSRSAAVTGARRLGIPEHRITVIERGRDPVRLGEPGEERHQRARARLGIDHDDRLILAVGRQVAAKGHADLLDAFDVLVATEPRAVVAIAGRPGEATAELERRRDRSANAARVLLLGHRDDVPDLLAAADVFALPSRYEGMPGALIEAMALGVPIVAADLPAVREVVTDREHALLVGRGDPARLARTIAELLEDQDLADAISGRARERFAERFTIERSAARMVSFYEEVLAYDRASEIEDALADRSDEPASDE